MEDQLKQITDRITSAYMIYRVWRIYTEPDDRAKYLKVLQRYNTFFLTSRHAHFLATIVALYGLYETRRESISLSRLVKDTRDDKLRRELEPMLDEAKSIWRKVAIVRNNIYAHLLDSNSQAIFSGAALSPNEIERLIELSKQLVNKLSYAHDHSTHAFNLNAAPDTYNLLDVLLRNGSQTRLHQRS
ncbi:MAG TPA: hypothetical protein VNF45_07125 [Candidatus Binataceae bacterium]|nr:hypothetical protein [Candidatus Binataceae bacterium]